jgi:hypothetical protein
MIYIVILHTCLIFFYGYIQKTPNIKEYLCRVFYIWVHEL